MSLKKTMYSLIFACIMPVIALSSITAMADAVPELSGLVKHVDASSITGLNDGDSVSVWEDMAGYNDFVTRSGDTDPVYVTGAINNLPVVRFSADGAMKASTTETHFSGNQPHTVFVVANPNAFSDDSVWHIGKDGSGTYSGFNLEDASAIGCRMGNGWNKFVPNAPYSLGVTSLFTISYSGTNYGDYALEINGQPTQNATNQAGNKMSMSNSTIHLGDRDNGTPGFDGDIAELLVFNKLLNSTEMAHVSSYLASKYALPTTYTMPGAYVVDQSPAEGAQRVGQDTQITWDVRLAEGTPAYSVFFGSDPNDVDPNNIANPAIPVAVTQDSFYSPPEALAPATTYYCRIAISDDAGSSYGNLTTFTTGGDVAGISPTDNATGLASSVTVSWAADAAGSSYIDGYEIYLDVDANDVDPENPQETITAAVTENQWQTPELADGITYNCRIVSMHGGETVLEGTTNFKIGELVGYWAFDGDLADSIGENDAARTADNFAEGLIDEASAVVFDGDSPVVVPTAGLGNSSNWTISCWEYSDPAAGGGWESILGCGSDDAGWGVFEFGRLNTKEYVWGFGNDDYQYTPHDDSYGRGEWHFHAMSYDRDARLATWYVNGVKMHEYANNTAVLVSEFHVGNVRGLSQPFTGKVDDLKLYSRPLTSAEVLNEYVNGVGGAPILPVPASGTRNVAWDVVLEWTASDSATGHTIEFGKLSDLSDATPIALAGDVSSFDLFAGLGVKLDLNTEYYWRITSTLPDKTVAGPVWFFEIRDLIGDLNSDLVVDGSDLETMAAKWLDDASTTVPSGTLYNFIDQEVWDVTGGDPNLGNYDAYAVGDLWGQGKLDIKTDPTPGDESYTPPSQTIIYTATGTSSQQQIVGIVFIDAIDFSEFDRMGFWAYQRESTGNFQFRPIDTDGNQPFGETCTIDSLQTNNDKWHNYEWDINRDTPTNIRKVDIWFADNEFTIEYGNFYLVKDGEAVVVCLEENRVTEDFNSDCMVNLLDLEFLAKDWMLDASN